MAQTIRSLTGSRSDIVFINRPTDDPTVRQPDITPARTALGWQPLVGFEDGLERTLGGSGTTQRSCPPDALMIVDTSGTKRCTFPLCLEVGHVHAIPQRNGSGAHA